MKLTTIIAHLSVPTTFSVGVFAYAVSNDSFSTQMLISALLGGLFYIAPYLLWLVVVALTKATNMVVHSGLIASTVALVIVASFWLLPPDQSGLPMQWMLYWPLAVFLQIILGGGSAIYTRFMRKTDSH